MGDNIKRRHHTVPRLLLAGFSANNRLVARMRSGEEVTISTRDATVHKDFYTFEQPGDGQTVRIVEDWFDTSVESPAAPLIEQLRAGTPPHEVDTTILARFVITCYLRTSALPVVLERISDHVGPILVLNDQAQEDDIDLLTISDDELNRRYASAQATYQHEGTDPDELTRRWLRILLRYSDLLTEQCTAWHWSCEHTSDHAFITADTPATTFNPRPGTGWSGLLPPGSPLYMPLSSRTLLTASPQPPLTHAEAQPTAETIKLVNNNLARNSVRSIYRHPDMRWPLDLELSTREPTIDDPHITLSESTGTPTFPATYPAVTDPETQDLLALLHAVNTVE